MAYFWVSTVAVLPCRDKSCVTVDLIDKSVVACVRVDICRFVWMSF